DPANIYVSAANEDSIFHPFFRDFETLDDRHKALLDEQFLSFLTSRYGTVNAAIDAWNDSGEGLCAPLKHKGDRKEAPIVLGATDLASACLLRRRDTIDHLVAVDGHAARVIRETLYDLGYRGLFSATNSWSGYGALETN